MTVQVAIMNKTAVALASDSAVTTTMGRKEKIFTSANKLFALSNVNPVGIMVYGNAELMGVPWETVIKLYRKQLNNTSFDTLKEYATNFVAFIEGGNTLISQSVKDEYVREVVLACMEYIRTEVENKTHDVINEKGQIIERQIIRIISEVVNQHHSKWAHSPRISTLSEDIDTRIISRYRSVIDRSIRKAFQRLPLSFVHRRQLREIAINALVKKLPDTVAHEEVSGVVIAGFGNTDTFPRLASFSIDGLVENKLRYWELHKSEIGPSGEPSSIVSFAQLDVVATFMEGVNPNYRKTQDSLFLETLRYFSEKAIEVAQTCGCTQRSDLQRMRGELASLRRRIKRRAQNQLEIFRHSHFVHPILAVVEMLPKDELAAMAEALVSLTKLQRRVSLEAETVGGAVDVAVISKGDGFVWTKRKLYFEAALNPRFMANKYNRSASYEEQGF